MKVCKTCGFPKELTKFKTCSSCKDKHTVHCRVCLNRKKKGQPSYIRDQRKRKLEKYGLTSKDYESILLIQKGKCAICGSTNPGNKNTNFSVDHDHKTGKVRGLLCSNCNTGLGHFRDSKEFLSNAIKYLK